MRIVENKLEITGNMEAVEEVISYLKGENGDVDFNNVIPLDDIKEDIQMDDYINACLNLYIQKNKEINEKNFISTMKFVGLTRKVPYSFREISQNEMNVYKAKYKVSEMLKVAQDFVELVEKKSIFNGYIVRETNWGTGNEPVNSSSYANRVKFITYGNPAENVIKKLSELFPDVRIIYTYSFEQKKDNNKEKIINQKVYRAGIEKDVTQTEFHSTSAFKMISAYVKI